VAREVEDLRAVLAATGAHAVFAVSAGALVALETARVESAIDKLAVMEPPFIVNGSPSTTFLERYDREIADGNVPGALVTGMRAAQMGPALLRALPDWILEPLVGKMITQQDKGARPGDVTMRLLAPTLHYDFVLVQEVAGPLDRYQSLGARLLLLDGSKSPAYLRTSVAALARAVPRAQRVTFKGLGHEASGNASERGKPSVVAAALRPFFGM
jgi:pimeloyl-ACP methyl ester carboxylesterase